MVVACWITLIKLDLSGVCHGEWPKRGIVSAGRIHVRTLDPDEVSFGTEEPRRSFPFSGHFALNGF